MDLSYPCRLDQGGTAQPPRAPERLHVQQLASRSSQGPELVGRRPMRRSTPLCLARLETLRSLGRFGPLSAPRRRGQALCLAPVPFPRCATVQATVLLPARGGLLGPPRARQSDRWRPPAATAPYAAKWAAGSIAKNLRGGCPLWVQRAHPSSRGCRRPSSTVGDTPGRGPTASLLGGPAPKPSGRPRGLSGWGLMETRLLRRGPSYHAITHSSATLSSTPLPTAAVPRAHLP